MSSFEAVLKASFQHSCKCQYLLSWRLVMITKLALCYLHWWNVGWQQFDKTNICTWTRQSRIFKWMLWIQLQTKIIVIHFRIICLTDRDNYQVSANQHGTICMKQPAGQKRCWGGIHPKTSGVPVSGRENVSWRVTKEVPVTTPLKTTPCPTHTAGHSQPL